MVKLGITSELLYIYLLDLQECDGGTNTLGKQVPGESAIMGLF